MTRLPEGAHFAADSLMLAWQALEARALLYISIRRGAGVIAFDCSIDI
jgi:hypothetical protein